MRLVVIASGLALAAAMTGGALAADLQIPAAPPIASPVSAYDWSGFYAGVFAGGGWSDHSFSIDPVGGGAGLGLGSADGSGALGGVRAGYDAQFDNFVLGAYVDIAASSVGVTDSLAPGGGAPVLSASTKLDWIGTVQAKLGVPISDSFLIYAHGGYAYGHATQSIAIGGASTSYGEAHNGYTVGVGAEYALSSNVALDVDYGYYDFGSATITSGGGAALNESITANVVTAGISYKF